MKTKNYGVVKVQQVKVDEYIMNKKEWEIFSWSNAQAKMKKGNAGGNIYLLIWRGEIWQVCKAFYLYLIENLI